MMASAAIPQGVTRNFPNLRRNGTSALKIPKNATTALLPVARNTSANPRQIVVAAAAAVAWITTKAALNLPQIPIPITEATIH